MGKTIRKNNVRSIDKWRGYYLEDCDCSLCKHFAGHKRGCRLEKCICEDEKCDAVTSGRVKRKRRRNRAWDG
ncbi:MAG: hypothetical protein FWF15_00035 [Oscillospiraceae bacterium]|nr:hypothetical protein [Oscillospiraceae bacterium]